MTEERERVVWVLGAGFSRSLGGPLLKDLFGAHLQERIIARYGLDFIKGPYLCVYALYHHADYRPNWDHAEQFLEYLDRATRDVARRQQVQKWIAKGLGDNIVSVDDLLAAAKRIVAAECCEFLADVDEQSERAGPYRRWAEKLSRTDAVITFNYDAAIEKLCRRGRFDVPTSADWDSYGATKQRLVPLYKLHGSVTWYRDATGAIREDRKSLEAAITLDSPVIAVPGQAKGDAVRGEFKAIWSFAMNSLQAADRIIFLGFGWPPSDAESRHALLEAMAANRQDRLTVHLVLGGNTVVTDRVRRLLELTALRAGRDLGATPPTRMTFLDVQVEPLNAEEFVEAYEPGVLR